MAGYGIETTRPTQFGWCGECFGNRTEL